jgi:hypothetical protein
MNSSVPSGRPRMRGVIRGRDGSTPEANARMVSFILRHRTMESGDEGCDVNQAKSHGQLGRGCAHMKSR